MLFWRYWPLICLIGCLSCSRPETGNLRIDVQNHDGPQSGVTVSLHPGRHTEVTDGAGTVLFRDIKSMEYTLTASHPVLGEQHESVFVDEDRTVEATVFMYGRYNQPPEAVIDRPHPDYTNTVAFGRPYEFRGMVADGEDGRNNVPWTITSNLDGELAAGVDSSFYVITWLRGLSPGLHKITLTATDSEGLTASALTELRVLRPEVSVTFYPVVQNGDANVLSWSRWPYDNNFASYQITRFSPYERAQTVALISAVEDTTFTDAHFPYNMDVSYYVSVNYRRPDGMMDQRHSDTLSTVLTSPRISVDGDITVLKTDPNRSRLYALEPAANRLLVIDTDKLQVRATLPTGSRPAGLSFSSDGDTLYVANGGANSVTVVDLTQEAIVRTQWLPLGPWDNVIRPRHVAALSDGRLAVIENESLPRLYLYRPGEDQLTLVPDISGVTGMESDRGGADLLVAQNGGGNVRALRLTTTDDGSLTLSDQSERLSDNSTFVLSGDRRWVFAGNAKLDAADLSLVAGRLGTDSYERVRLSNHDGSVVMTDARYIDATTFTEISPLRAPWRVVAYEANHKVSYRYDREISAIVVIPFPR